MSDVTRTLQRTCEILQVLTHAPDGLTWTELNASITEAPPSTLSRLLKAMQDSELIVKNPDRRYLTGAQFHAWQMGGHSHPLAYIQLTLRELTINTGESSAWMTPDKSALLIAAKHEAAEAFGYARVGFMNQHWNRHGFLLAWKNSMPSQQRIVLEKSDPDYAKSVTPQVIDEVIVNHQDDRPGIMRIAYTIKGFGVIGLSGFHDPDKTRIQLLCQHVKQAGMRVEKHLNHHS